MDFINLLQEKYIAEFSNNTPFWEYVINLLVTAILTAVLRWYYIRFGSAISNRRKFANNFMALALGTLLIIMIVKSSIALSLGLVGALSIVRFRAAIKDPEELTFLFVAIGIGLAGGANQPVLAAISVVFILGILWVHRWWTGQASFRAENRMFVNIQTDLDDLEKVSATLISTFKHVELKRMDTLAEGMALSYICKADSLAQIAQLKQKVQALSDKTSLSIIDQPDLIV